MQLLAILQHYINMNISYRCHSVVNVYRYKCILLFTILKINRWNIIAFSGIIIRDLRCGHYKYDITWKNINMSLHIIMLNTFLPKSHRYLRQLLSEIIYTRFSSLQWSTETWTLRHVFVRLTLFANYPWHGEICFSKPGLVWYWCYHK